MPSSPYSYAQRLMSDSDLAFVTSGDTFSSDALADLRHSLATDERARAELLGAEHLFRRVLNLDDAFLRISPRLFFEVLLRRSIYEIAHSPHVLERVGQDRVPLFLGDDELRIVSQPVVIDYLADLLASFTKIHSHTARVRVRRGVWRKSRYSDLDVPSLLRLASQAEGAEQQRVYKRAADASLLILGVFPDYATAAMRYPGTGTLRRRGARLTTEEYEDVASRAYKLAAEHPETEATQAEPMLMLSDHVIDAKRPLSRMADQFLRFRRGSLFGMGS
ncbi:MAG: hypothetical protein O2826_01610 [Chloroflexi bacterium]|nr:hypothetical protein [Chloroflexota bacterium]MDA1173200.1 hypothetical protein [Chloroflexota bacterium]